MCLIIFRWQPQSNERLILIANRDEFYHRPTQKLHTWAGSNGITAGKDESGGGTWLGMSGSNRFCALTNYREIPNIDGIQSRGQIPLEFLQGTLDAEAFAQHLAHEQANHTSQPPLYSGFNAVFFDGEQLVYSSNRTNDEPFQILAPGDYALCNHLLDTPWPKLLSAKEKFIQTLDETHTKLGSARDEALFALMENSEQAADDSLPDTGIGISGERLLSSIFIKSAAYGTRATSLVEIQKSSARLIERSFSPNNTHTAHNDGSSLSYEETRITL